MQQSPELSLQYFNEAKRLRHLGDFKRSIEMLKMSILVYQADPDLPTNFYSMGKTYYLDNNFRSSLKCYEIYNNLCALRNPAIIEDYSNFCNPQPPTADGKSGEEFLNAFIGNFMKSYVSSTEARIRFQTSFRNLAHNVGHSINDSANQNRYSLEIRWYQQELLGQNPGNSIPDVYSSYQQYDEKCTDIGFNKIYSWLDNFLTSKNMTTYTITMINDIINN